MSKMTLIAGPCAIENKELCFEVAEKMKEITDRLEIDYIFKSSFDKANRTSIHSYRGPGIEEGVNILAEIKNKYGLKVTTDIHEPSQAKLVKDVVDIIQIPAFLCRQTDLLVAAAETGKTVNVKKAQFLAPWDMKNVVNKLEEAGCKDIMLCERGTTFGYNRLVVDMPGMIEMEKLGYPVVFDVTHSVQKPGGAGNTTNGNREYIQYLAKGAVAMGINNFFMEVHPDPDNALSDGPNQLPLDSVEILLKDMLKIKNALEK